MAEAQAAAATQIQSLYRGHAFRCDPANEEILEELHRQGWRLYTCERDFDWLDKRAWCVFLWKLFFFSAFYTSSSCLFFSYRGTT